MEINVVKLLIDDGYKPRLRSLSISLMLVVATLLLPKFLEFCLCECILRY